MASDCCGYKSCAGTAGYRSAIGRHGPAYKDRLDGTAGYRSALKRYGPAYKPRLDRRRYPVCGDGPGMAGDFSMDFDRPVSLDELPSEIIRKPRYLDDAPVTRRVSRFAKPVMGAVNRDLAETEGAVLTYGDLKIGSMEPQWVVDDEGRICKVLGCYNTRTGELRISKDLADMPDWLLAYVFTHEVKHYVQDKFGVISYYTNISGSEKEARRLIEDDAEEGTKRVLGRYTNEVQATSFR